MVASNICKIRINLFGNEKEGKKKNIQRIVQKRRFCSLKKDVVY